MLMDSFILSQVKLFETLLFCGSCLLIITHDTTVLFLLYKYITCNNEFLLMLCLKTYKKYMINNLGFANNTLKPMFIVEIKHIK